MKSMNHIQGINKDPIRPLDMTDKHINIPTKTPITPLMQISNP